MKTILVAFDGSEGATNAVRRAATFAKAFEASVHVTSVAPVLVGGPHGTGPYDPADPPAEHEKQLQQAQALLAEEGVVASLDPATGDVPEAILDVADRIDADLIVLGSHERSLVERALGVSVSGAVSRKAHRDVLIVH